MEETVTYRPHMGGGLKDEWEGGLGKQVIGAGGQGGEEALR